MGWLCITVFGTLLSLFLGFSAAMSGDPWWSMLFGFNAGWGWSLLGERIGWRGFPDDWTLFGSKR